MTHRLMPHEAESLFMRWARFKQMRLRDIERHAEEVGVTLNYAVGARRNYLWKELDFWLEVDLGPTEWAVFCAPRIWEIFGEMIRLHRDLYWKSKPVRHGETTEEMKQRARDYPVTSLIDFGRNGTDKVIAFCHDDKTPSMFYGSRKKRAICPVCNRHFDAVGVLMVRDGKGYHDAVRLLQ